ncbi:hypothetical protein [Pedobacter sp. B4-66]|uniref:hypothetical protein n=1 Tax=Pedobacter sp. B4-66 TaxID=2817280 RepID=UPI001BDA8FFF|nr:hypothetical protein [Pedobacter sp. B4-66]
MLLSGYKQEQYFIKKISLLILLLPLLIGTSCKKQTNGKFTEAVILDGGPIETEQCGWIIKVNDNYYSAVNLPKEFEHDKIHVFINYALLNEDFICGNATTYRAYKKIKITEVKKK